MRSKKLQEEKEKGRKGLISKTLARCRTFSSGRSCSDVDLHAADQRQKNYSPPARTPSRCFSVYVGPERERFVVRMEHLNHPHFRVLLEEAEMAYGYKSDGPLKLPCQVDLFCRVLWEMEDDAGPPASPMCTFTTTAGPRATAGYKPLSPNGTAVLHGRHRSSGTPLSSATSYI